MNDEKLELLKAILKENNIEGKMRAFPSETNKNEIEIQKLDGNEYGYYCTVNLRSRKVKDI